jgi:prepilin-type N-terminal cleavage/methylation domain-containing protein
MRKLNIKRQSGFTIIEVLIVLAIAGLILLVVFLAVPGLQRNAHNTTAKNDVASILGAMSEYVNNNSGSLPPAETAGNMGSGGTLYVGDTQTNCTAANSTKNCATAKIGYFDAANVSIQTTTPAAPAVGNVVIVLKATCNGNAPQVSATSPRGYAAYYTLEGGAIQCQAS